MFRKRGSDPDEEAERILRRVQKIGTQDLMSWADQSLFSLGRTLSEYQRHGAVEDLAEARMSATALKVVIDDLYRRVVVSQTVL